MPIVKYELVKPIINKDKPYINKYGAFIVPRIHTIYKYYIEVMRYNTSINDYDFFILLSDSKFSSQCRKCSVDCYGRLKINIHGKLKEFITAQIANVGTVDFGYVETESDNNYWYDVWEIKECSSY